MCVCNPSVRTPWCGKPGCTPPAVPELGKMPVVHGWFLAFELECPCGAFRMHGAAVGQTLTCRSCPRVFKVDGFHWNPDTSSIAVDLTLGFRQPDPASKLVL